MQHRKRRLSRGGFALAAGVAAILACRGDAGSPVALEQPPGAFPRIVGSYGATTVMRLSSAMGSGTWRCSGVLDIPTQADSTFSGTLAIQASGDCDAESAAVAGTVSMDSALTLMADFPGGGSNMWEDAAAESGCSLVEGDPLTGALSADTLSAAGRASYDCPFFGATTRVNAAVDFKATRNALLAKMTLSDLAT